MKNNTVNVKQANRIKAAVKKNTKQDGAIVRLQEQFDELRDSVAANIQHMGVLETRIDKLRSDLNVLRSDYVKLRNDFDNLEIKYPWKQEFKMLALYGIVGAGFVVAAILSK